MTLRARLGIAGLVVVAVLVAVAVLLPRRIASVQLAEVDRRLASLAPVAVLVADRGVQAPPTGVGRPDSGTTAALSDVYVAAVAGGGRRVIVGAAAAATGAPDLPPTGPTPLSAPRAATVGSTGGRDLWRALYVAAPDGTAVVLAVPLDEVRVADRGTVVAVTVSAGVVLLALGAAGWWLLRLGLRPIAELTEVADAIAGGARDRRAGATPPGTEAGRLSRAFNVMLDERDAEEERLRRFVADASHELRTPVAAIAGLADLWRLGDVAADATPDMMRRIGQEAARMHVLVDDLLLLASLDAGRRPTVSPVDLATVAADAVATAEAAYPSRPVTVVAAPGAVVAADAEQLRAVATNLVVNALAHTDPPARVTVTVRCDGPDVTLVVADEGGGMDAAELARAFDRFWRAERARGRRGSGLGLPLVKAIVEAHGGTVALESSPGVGTVARVSLPASGRRG